MTQPPLQVQQPLETQASMSSQPTRMSFAVAKDYKPTSIKFDNVESLERQSNYEDWASQIAFALDTMSVREIVIDGIKPAANQPHHQTYITEDISNRVEQLSDMDLDIDVSPTYTCKLDTCASTHMTSDIDLFEGIQPSDGIVGVGGGEYPSVRRRRHSFIKLCTS